MTNNNHPLISVIVPVYNSEIYLEECIDSILKQTFKDFELILLDDGSTDNSPSICDNYSKLDKRIVVKHKKNEGVSATRNYGISISKAAIISFVDSDDVLSNSFLETLYNGLISNNCDIAACYRKKFFSEEELKGLREIKETEINLVLTNFADFYHSFNERGNLNVIWNKIYKKSLFDGLSFPANRRHEDVYIIHRVLARAKSMFVSGQHLYFYRKHENGFMAQGNFADLIWVNSTLISFYNEDFKNKERLVNSILDAITLSTHEYKNRKKYPQLSTEISSLKETLKPFKADESIGIYNRLLIISFLINVNLCKLLLWLKRK